VRAAWRNGAGRVLMKKGEVLEVVLDQEAGHINEVHPLLNSLQQFLVSEKCSLQRYFSESWIELLY
jgi:hypothetical protein